MDMNINAGLNIGPAMNTMPAAALGPWTAPFAGMSRDCLLKEVMAADFYLIDLNLYLNTHPCDQKALALYICGVQKAQMVRNAFERMYGPLTPLTAASCDRWHWIDDPWPWQKQ